MREEHDLSSGEVRRDGSRRKGTVSRKLPSFLLEELRDHRILAVLIEVMTVRSAAG